MNSLNDLQNKFRPRKAVRRKGRGPGCGKGKTCGRGHKGAGARSGYSHRYGYEGGQFRTFMKMPIRGFSNVRFRKALDTVNLGQIDAIFSDGDHVTIQTLAEQGFIKGPSHGLKVLGEGELKKKVSIEAKAFSQSALEKLRLAKIAITIVE